METINEAEIWVNAGTFFQKLFATPKRKGFVVRCERGKYAGMGRKGEGVCLPKKTYKGDREKIYIIPNAKCFSIIIMKYIYTTIF